VALVVVVVAAACHDLSRQRPDMAAADSAPAGQDRGPRDARPDQRRDSKTPPDLACDGVQPLDTSPDSPHPPDQHLPDLKPPPCVAKAAISTVALYSFDTGTSATLLDATGKHNGSIVGAGISRKPGKPGCGNALHFSGSGTTTSGYATIPDHAAWQLKKGSLDFWVQIDAPAPKKSQGIVARDATGSGAGHLSVMYTCEGRIMARLQTGKADQIVCSDMVTVGSWHHVGLNFGPPGLKLHVNGKATAYTGKITLGSTCQWTLTCGTPGSAGISGNKEPWVLGAAAYLSAAGKATPIYDRLKGAIDSFRISNIHLTSPK